MAVILLESSPVCKHSVTLCESSLLLSNDGGMSSGQRMYSEQSTHIHYRRY